MNKIFKITLFFYLITNIFNISNSDENFFEKGIKFYNNKNYDGAKFMFEKSIVFNPKDSNSYLYLAKIYNIKEDHEKEEKNLVSTLLIEPDNEEAILMSMKAALDKSNYSRVRDLSETFNKVCKKLCGENKDILETLANIEPKNNES